MKLKFALAAVLGALTLSSSLAQAQYYDPYGRPPPPRYYERPAPGYGYERPYSRPVPVGTVCVTSRGDCRWRPSPLGAGCRCNIPGFGLKRGNVEY